MFSFGSAMKRFDVDVVDKDSRGGWILRLEFPESWGERQALWRGVICKGCKTCRELDDGGRSGEV